MGIEGDIAIRSLSDSEFEFLEKFNSEFVQGNFKRDENGNITNDNLHYNLVNGTEDKIKDLKDEIKAVRFKLMETNGYREMNDRKAYWKYKKNLYKKYTQLKEDLVSIDIVKNIYDSGYARRNDLMAYTGKEERTVLVTDNFFNLKFDTNEESLFEYIESTKI